MNKIEISEIQIVPIHPQNGLVAFASFVCNQLRISNVAIYTSLNSQWGFRLVYPTKVLSNGKNIPCVYPINKIAGETIQKAVIAKFEELIENAKKCQGADPLSKFIY